MVKILFFLLVSSLMYADPSYYENGKLIKLQEVKMPRAKSLVKDNVKFYQNQRGNLMGVKDEILVLCKDSTKCKYIFADLNLTNYRALTPTIFLLKVSQDPFEISKKLYSYESIKAAHPNFIKKRKRR